MAAGLRLRDFRNGPKRAAKIGEAAQAERPVLRLFRELQLDPGRDGERAFGSGQQAGKILIFRIGEQGAEVVAFRFRRAGRAQRPVGCDGLLMDFAELEKIDKAVAPRKGLLIGFGDGAKENALTVCKKGVGATDGIAHRAVAHGSQPARIVAQHPADCGLSGGRNLDRKEKIVRVERRLQRRGRASRLHRASAVLRVDLGDPREILGKIDDDAFAKRLSRGRACRRRAR